MVPDYPTIASDPATPVEEGFSAPVNPEDIENAKQASYLRLPALDDTEATHLYERLPFLPDSERSGALEQLNRYAAERERQDAQARHDERKRDFLDPKARIEWLGRPDVQENLHYLEDSNAAYDRMAVRKFVERDIAGRELSDPEYEAARNEYIGRRMAGKIKVSDQEAFGILSKEVGKATTAEDAVDAIEPELIKGFIQSQIAKKPFLLGDAWDKARKSIPDLTPKQETDLYADVAQRAKAIQERIGRNPEAITSVYTYFEKGRAGTATVDDEKAMMAELFKIPQEDLEQTLLTAAAAVKTGDIDPGFFTKLIKKERDTALDGYGLGSSVRGMSNTAVDMHIAQARKKVLDGTAKMTKTGDILWTPTFTQRDVVTGPLTEEQKAFTLQKLAELEKINQIDRTVKDVFETKVKNIELFSPVTSPNAATIERLFYGARSQVGPMTLMALSPLTYMAVVGSQSYEATMRANPNMDKGVAARMAGVEATINFIGDSIQLGRAKSFVQGLFKNIPAGRKIARGVWTYGVETATELGQDYFSAVGKRVTQEVMQEMRPDLDVGKMQEWHDMMSWEQVGETAGQMFFLAGIGVGVLTYRDVMDPQKAVYNDEMLKRAGIPQDKIDAILGEDDFGERDRMLKATLATLTPEQKNNGILYSQTQDAKARAKVATGGTEVAVDGAEATFVAPQLVAKEMKDGTRTFTLLDQNGSVVREGMTEEVGNAEYNDLYRQVRQQWIAERVEEQASEQEVAKGVAAEARWNLLSVEDRTTLGNIVEYSHVEQSPEQQRAIAGLRAALKGRGVAQDVVAVSVDNPSTRAGKSAINFVNWFQSTFGKRVVFVASETGQPLGFDGVVNPADPDTIFLNASGDRNVLALLGHEWSHTLEATNPTLWKETVEKMKPLVVEWARQTGKLVGEHYTEKESESEFVANIVGDAFADPEFWKLLHSRDKGLFERMVAAVQEWFDTIIDRASAWGTEAPDIIRDLQGMRQLLVEMTEQARQGPEGAAPAGAPAAVITPEMHQQLLALGFDDTLIAAMSPLQAEYYLERPAQMSVRLHHGTKTKGIKQWVLDFLGTGEGNIAFGWGLYYAENPEVARRYRRLLGGEEKVLTIGGKEKYDTTNPLHVAAYWLATNEAKGMTRDQAAAQALVDHRGVRLSGGPSIQTPLRTAALGALDILEKATDPNADSIVPLHAIPDFRIETRTGGEIYTLDADVTRAEVLDLDRRMNDQPPYVMDKIMLSGIDFDPNKSGEAFQKLLLLRYYKEMLAEKWKSDPDHPFQSAEKQMEFEGKRRASMWLKSIGIPANTFADNFSRKQWRQALQDHYEVMSDLEGTLADYNRFEGQMYEGYRQELREEIQKEKESLLRAKKQLNVTSNWVIWEPERIKEAPEGERVQFSRSRIKGFKAVNKEGVRLVPSTGLTHIAQDRGVAERFAGGKREVMEVEALVEKPFDFRVKEDVEWLVKEMTTPENVAEYNRQTKEMMGAGYDYEVTDRELAGALEDGAYQAYEIPLVSNLIKSRGYDGIYLVEEGEQYLPPNLAVFSADQIVTPKAKLAVSRESGHKFGRVGTRMVDENGGYISDAEVLKLEASVNTQLDAKGHKGAKRKRFFEQAMEMLTTDVKGTRARNPDASTGVEDPWDTLEVTGADLEFKTADDIKAVAAWKGIPYRFDQIPDGMTREQWKNDLAGRVMKQFIERLQLGTSKGATKAQREGAELILKEIEWYRDFIHKLRQDFGGTADLMADLLGAFSPRQNVRLNVRNAIDAMWAISAGKYDTVLRELDAYMKADPSHTIESWRKQGGATMKAKSGNLFGTNTNLGHLAALGLWREIRAGDAPKAKNFTRNLIGLSIRATIDVWAARLLDRVAGKPRIPVDGEGAVQGRHLTEAQVKKRFGEEVPDYIPVEGQFAFGQEVFERVAEMMRDPATWTDSGLSQKIVDAFKVVTPSDVQAMNWFVEKEIWAERGWTNEEGSGGSFMHEIEQHLGTRFQVGLSQAVSGRAGFADFLPQDPDQARFISEIHDDLMRSMPEVLALRIMDSLGMFKGSGERSLDLEFTTAPGMEPNDIMRAFLYHAWSKDQEATHISRVLEPWEQADPNTHRPGVEIYLKAGSDISALDPVMKRLQKHTLNGFTMIVDPRAKMGSGEFLGVRFQYVPEYSGDGPQWAKKGKNVAKAIDRAIIHLAQIQDVAYAKLVYYDTVVFQKGLDYDDAGVNPGAVGTVEARSWRRRYFDYMAQKAVRRDDRAKLIEQHHADVHGGVPVEQEAEPTGLAPPGGPVDVNVFDRNKGAFVPTPMNPTKSLLKTLRQEARSYSQLIECLSA